MSVSLYIAYTKTQDLQSHMNNRNLTISSLRLVNFLTHWDTELYACAIDVDGWLNSIDLQLIWFHSLQATKLEFTE